MMTDAHSQLTIKNQCLNALIYFDYACTHTEHTVRVVTHFSLCISLSLSLSFAKSKNEIFFFWIFCWFNRENGRPEPNFVLISVTFWALSLTRTRNPQSPY